MTTQAYVHRTLTPQESPTHSSVPQGPRVSPHERLTLTQQDAPTHPCAPVRALKHAGLAIWGISTAEAASGRPATAAAVTAGAASRAEATPHAPGHPCGRPHVPSRAAPRRAAARPSPDALGRGRIATEDARRAGSSSRSIAPGLAHRDLGLAIFAALSRGIFGDGWIFGSCRGLLRLSALYESLHS